MQDARAITGSLVDARNVATHKSFRLVIDIPAEDAMKALEAFGWPTQVNPVPVAVARLSLKPDKEVVPDTRSLQTDSRSRPGLHNDRASGKSWDELPLAQQAGIRCNEESFWKFLAEEHEGENGVELIDSAEKAAVYVRLICSVKSRADLDKSSRSRILWRDLDAKFQAWLADPVMVA